MPSWISIILVQEIRLLAFCITESYNSQYIISPSALSRRLLRQHIVYKIYSKQQTKRMAAMAQ